MRTAFIYGLRCPLTGLIRYIGKSINPRKRLSRHLHDSRNRKGHRENWLLYLSKQGLKPTLEIIAKVPELEWEFWERSYIRLYRCLGFALVNGTDGGEGAERGEKNYMYRKTHTPEACTKISVANLGRVAGEEECANKSIGHLNKKTTQNSSGFVGVGWHKGAKKWRASLNLSDRKHLHLGCFTKIEDAVFVRNLAFNKYYGSNQRGA